MSIEVAGEIIRIIGNAPVEDAEPLLVALQQNALPKVDLHQAAHLHSAIIQLLLAVRPAVIGAPATPFFATYVLPLLDRDRGKA